MLGSKGSPVGNTRRKHPSSYLVAFERELLYAKDHALFSRPYYNGRAVGTVLRLTSSVVVCL